jgi:hypothetical protein
MLPIFGISFKKLDRFAALSLAGQTLFDDMCGEIAGRMAM